MTVKTVKFNGTDWADGNVLYAADQNDTFGACVGEGITMTAQTEASAEVKGVYLDSTDDHMKVKYTNSTMRLGAILAVTTGSDISLTNTGNDTETMTIPAATITNHIHIQAVVHGYATCSNGGDSGAGEGIAYGSFSVYKTYAAADTDLITNTQLFHADADAEGGGNSYNADHDRDSGCTQLNFLYVPTTLEKTNGFTITVKINYTETDSGDGSASGTIAAKNMAIFGV